MRFWKSTDFYYKKFAPYRQPLTEEQLFNKLLSRVVVDANGCWVWQGSKDSDGYGWFYGGRASDSGNIKNEKAHRVSLSFALGRELGEGMKACHTCHNPPCINPEHLYEGTQFDNERDKVQAGRHANQLKTHCPNGHEYTEGTTYHRPDHPTWRECLICRQRRDVARRG